MSDAPYEPTSEKAIEELVNGLRPLVEGGDELGLDEILDLPEAKRAIAAWGVEHEVAALGHGGNVAPWLRPQCSAAGSATATARCGGR